MKKTIQYLVFGLVMAGLLFFSSCTRTNVADPDMDNNDSYYINLSGTANPSTLFIPTAGQDSSTIHLLAHFNTGEPVVGREILLKLDDDIGYFPNDKRTITLVTNSQGRASTIYTVKHFVIDLIGPSKLIYIAAYIMSDLNPVNVDFHENIPILLLTTYTEVDTLAATPAGPITFEIDPSGAQEIYVYNSSGGDNPIAYTYSVDVGWITITGFTGSTAETLSVECSTNAGSARTGYITLTASSSEVLNSPIIIQIDQEGT